MINCPNPSCKTANPEGAEVCQVCQSALPHFYLWGVGDLVANIRPGQLLNQRYLLKRDHTFLDTKPGLIPESLPELPDFLLPYLHLSAYPLHLPRPYSVMRTPDDDYVLMLESSALSSALDEGASPGEAPRLLPMLTECWAAAPPLRQLNWLWQVAQIWDVFDAEKVAATLLDESLLRVDGSVLRLLALTPPTVSGSPTLMDLSRFWQPLAETAHQAVRACLTRLCERLERQQLTAEQLSEQLSQAISVCSQDQVVNYDLAVYTDQGPTRKRNEDACLPASGTSQSLTARQTRTSPELVIVCDGIGGHQGGDVASKLAITTIEDRLKPLLANDLPDLSATELTVAIEAAICAANDEISAQNDQAQRQARDRMGTTLVLALVKGADVFIAHLGDSRAYRISQHNCQQVTLDDDVASRQVRLGGSLYREVLPQPGSGSLIQALGMGSSQTLRPTVQRFVLDESCVFLLCSDGLSDSDRVEQFWQSVLRPLVTSTGSTAEVGKCLVDLANKYNGHDNVTVGLLNAQVVRASERMVPRELVGAVTASRAMASVATTQGKETTQLQSNSTLLIAPIAKKDAIAIENTDATSTTMPLVGDRERRSSSGVPKAILALLLLAVLGGALYVLFPGLIWRFTSSATDVPVGADATSSSRLPTSPAPVRSPVDLSVGAYVRIHQSDIDMPGIRSSPAPNLPAGSQSNRWRDDSPQLRLYPKSAVGSEAAPNVITGTIPTGAIVKVISKQVTADQSEWVQLKLCSIPSGETLGDVPAETDGPLVSSPISSPAEDPLAIAPPLEDRMTDLSLTTPPTQMPVKTPLETPLNAPEATETGRPLMLSPGSEGWAIAAKIAAVSENIQDLEPTQAGTCGS